MLNKFYRVSWSLFPLLLIFPLYGVLGVATARAQSTDQEIAHRLYLHELATRNQEWKGDLEREQNPQKKKELELNVYPEEELQKILGDKKVVELKNQLDRCEDGAGRDKFSVGHRILCRLKDLALKDECEEVHFMDQRKLCHAIRLSRSGNPFIPPRIELELFLGLDETFLNSPMANGPISGARVEEIFHDHLNDVVFHWILVRPHQMDLDPMTYTSIFEAYAKVRGLPLEAHTLGRLNIAIKKTMEKLEVPKIASKLFLDNPEFLRSLLADPLLVIKFLAQTPDFKSLMKARPHTPEELADALEAFYLVFGLEDNWDATGRANVVHYHDASAAAEDSGAHCALSADTLTEGFIQSMQTSLKGISKEMKNIQDKDVGDRLALVVKLWTNYETFLTNQSRIYADRIKRENIHGPLLRIDLLHKITGRVLRIMRQANISGSALPEGSHEKAQAKWAWAFQQWAANKIQLEWLNPFDEAFSTLSRDGGDGEIRKELVRGRELLQETRMFLLHPVIHP